MADLPNRDLAVDGAELRRSHCPVFRGDISSESEKRFSSFDDHRVDSGVGISFSSQDFSSLSLAEERNSFVSESDTSKALLANQLRNLSLRESERTKDACQHRYDSGISSVDESEYVVASAFPECVTPLSQFDNDLSLEELEELFSQDEDGDS